MRINSYKRAFPAVAVFALVSCAGPNLFFSHEHIYQLNGWGTNMPGKQDGDLSSMKLSNRLKQISPELSNGEIIITLSNGESKTFQCMVNSDTLRNVVSQDRDGNTNLIGDITSWEWETTVRIALPISRIVVIYRGERITQKNFNPPILKWPAA